MSDYNTTPENLHEIPMDEWQNIFFTYCLPEPESRQTRDHFICDLRMFDIKNWDNKKIGIAIMRDWYDNELKKNRPTKIIRFCKYGLDEDWERFQRRFAAQFAGDNS